MPKTLKKPIHEEKISTLISNIKQKKTHELLEASGIVVVDGNYYVVFDEMTGIARIPAIDNDGFRKGVIIGSQKCIEGYEAITFDVHKNQFFAIVENSPDGDGFFRPAVQPLDLALTKLSDPVALPLNLPLDNLDPNKGLEGAAIVYKNNETYLFGLCEGRGCNSDDSKTAKGTGMIQVFTQTRDSWTYYGHLHLPPEVDFRDFSDLSIRKNRIAVVSQKSAKLWIGNIMPTSSSWKLTHQCSYDFPKKNNKIKYCNVEGIDWVSKYQLIVVSDKASRKRCKKKEMMIHLFNIPQ